MDLWLAENLKKVACPCWDHSGATIATRAPARANSIGEKVVMPASDIGNDCIGKEECKL